MLVSWATLYSMVGEPWILIECDSDAELSIQTQRQRICKGQNNTNDIWPYGFLKHNLILLNDSESAQAL